MDEQGWMHSGTDTEARLSGVHGMDPWGHRRPPPSAVEKVDTAGIFPVFHAPDFHQHFENDREKAPPGFVAVSFGQGADNDEPLVNAGVDRWNAPRYRLAQYFNVHGVLPRATGSPTT